MKNNSRVSTRVKQRSQKSAEDISLQVFKELPSEVMGEDPTEWSEMQNTPPLLPMLPESQIPQGVNVHCKSLMT